MPRDKTMVTTTEFVNETWQHFAPYAYEKFLKHGKGAIRIDISQIKITPKPDGWVDVDGPTRYLEIDSDEVLNIASDALDKRLEEYNPEREVCFLFVEPVGTAGANHLVLKGAPSNQPGPKELYEARNQQAQSPH